MGKQQAYLQLLLLLGSEAAGIDVVASESGRASEILDIHGTSEVVLVVVEMNERNERILYIYITMYMYIYIYL